MSFSQSLLQLVAIWFVVLLVPGQDMVLLIKTVATQGRQQALYLTYGFCAALLIHSIVAISSVGAILSQSPNVMSTIQKVGGLYLGYLAITSIYSAFKNQSTLMDIKGSTEKLSKYSAMRVGFFSTILNTKVTLFFLSLFVGFVTPQTKNWHLATYVLTVVVMTYAFNFTLTHCLSSKFFIQKLNENSRKIEVITAGILLLVGMKFLAL